MHSLTLLCRMNIRIVLVCALACMFAAPALATFPIIIASGTAATISGEAVLLGALGLTAVGYGALLGAAVSSYLL